MEVIISGRGSYRTAKMFHQAMTKIKRFLDKRDAKSLYILEVPVPFFDFLILNQLVFVDEFKLSWEKSSLFYKQKVRGMNMGRVLHMDGVPVIPKIDTSLVRLREVRSNEF